jgi:hypothetical protein
VIVRLAAHRSNGSDTNVLDAGELQGDDSWSMRETRMTGRVVLLATCMMGLVAAPASASCIPSTERDYLQRSHAVFVGKVVSVRSGDARANFRVLRVVKGQLRRGARVAVSPWLYPSSITINWAPRLGQHWRVYVQRAGRRWITNDCLGTRRV